MCVYVCMLCSYCNALFPCLWKITCTKASFLMHMYICIVHVSGIHMYYNSNFIPVIFVRVDVSDYDIHVHVHVIAI